MDIRIAQKGDLAQLVNIYNQAIQTGRCTADTETFSEAQRQNWFESHSAESYPLLVAKHGDEVLGYLTLSPYRFARKALKQTAEVSYYIDFKHHRKGVASELLSAAITMCPSIKINTLVAILIDCNLGSVSFLNNKGFEEWGRFPKIVRLGDDYFDHLYYG